MATTPRPATTSLALTPEQKALVCALLNRYAPGRQVFVFGSRVVTREADQRRLKRHSDLDLALGAPPLSWAEMDSLREAFSQSDLPMRVDIAYAADLPDDWKWRFWALNCK